MIRDGEKFNFDSLVKVNEERTVEDAIGELYDHEDGNSDEPFILTNAPESEYRAYLRSSNNEIRNHEVRYPAEKVQHRISLFHKGEIGRMFLKNYGQQTERIDIHRHINDWMLTNLLVL